MIPFCVWNIWLKRTHNAFNNKKKGINASTTISQAIVFQLIIAKEKNKIRNKSTIQLLKPLDHNAYKLNVDGAVRNNSRPGGLEGVIRNHLGLWEVGFIEHTPLMNPIRSELQALRRGLSIAVPNGEARNHKDGARIS
ncbi:hypothetical protein R3W88_008134 [Solanum pinnatisectum]|uniref:RNase H type-1 domain-containing protein n=1 Tax=Solanum pinnatisectum TaxID=50273 RepID=A0AAV9M7T9_9SOLN|nr:hypothetical protein R3W88_008134 [Solanum pinnatisectum]